MEGWSKSAIDRLGDRLRENGGSVAADREAYETFRADHYVAMDTLRSQIEHELGGFAVTARLKTIESTVAKLRRGSFRLSRIGDIVGVRTTVPTLTEQQKALGRCVEMFPGCRVNDYLDAPHLGYRALHVLLQLDGRRAEVQLRTPAQDLWANTSERLAAQHGLELKYGGGQADLRQYLDWLSGRILEMEKATDGRFDLMETLLTSELDVYRSKLGL